MEAMDQLRDQVMQAGANMDTLTQTVATETQQLIDKITALEGQVIDTAAVQDLTTRMTAINQAMQSANTAIQNMVADAPSTPEPPPQP